MESTNAKVTIRGNIPGYRRVHLRWVGNDGQIYDTMGRESAQENINAVIKRLCAGMEGYDPKEARKARQLAKRALS